MKHLIWDYKGYNDLDLDFDVPGLQQDWNATLLTKLNMAFDGDNYNIFCSQPIFDIFKDIFGYDDKDKTIFSKKIIVLTFTTPKIYVTKPEVYDFTMLQHDNHGSVTVKNYVIY
jgi:hypothetical protein